MLYPEETASAKALVGSIDRSTMPSMPSLEELFSRRYLCCSGEELNLHDSAESLFTLINNAKHPIPRRDAAFTSHSLRGDFLTR